MINSNYADATRVYAGDGATTSFAIAFNYLSDTDNVAVYLKDDTTGVLTPQTTPAEFSFSGSNVVFVTAPASGKTVILAAEFTQLQESDYTEYGLFPAETLESDLDKLALGIQLVDEKADRALRPDASVSGFDSEIVGTPTAGQIPVVNATEDGLEWTDAVDAGVVTFATGVADFLETPSSANLKTAVTDETGSGALVFATSPTLVTPVLGTPASGTLTNCTGLPVTGLASGTSANLASVISDETGSGSLVFATSPTLVTPVLGTPASGTLTNCTGLPASSLSSIGSVSTATVATGDLVLIGDVSDSNNVKTVTAQAIANLASAAGAWTKITSTTASGASSVTFTGLTSSYHAYVVIFNKVTTSVDADIMLMRTSTDGGSTYDSTAGHYSWTFRSLLTGSTTSESTNTSATAILCSRNSTDTIGNAANEDICGRIMIFDPSATGYTKILVDSIYSNTSTVQVHFVASGARLSAADVDAIQLFMSSGTISGDFILYGITA